MYDFRLIFSKERNTYTYSFLCFNNILNFCLITVAPPTKFLLYTFCHFFSIYLINVSFALYLLDMKQNVFTSFFKQLFEFLFKSNSFCFMVVACCFFKLYNKCKIFSFLLYLLRMTQNIIISLL